MNAVMIDVVPSRRLRRAARVTGVLVLLALAACSTDSPQAAHGWFVQTAPKGHPNVGYRLWVAGDHDIWLGSSSIWHFDGVQWRETPPPQAMVVQGFQGFGRFDLWAFGQLLPAGPTAGIVIHWNGAVWTEVPPPSGVHFDIVAAMAGTSSRDLWISDPLSGRLYHYDGTLWTPYLMTTTSEDTLWASSPSDVWFSAYLYPNCWHFNGTMWTQYEGQPCMYGLGAVWGFAPDDVWSTSGNGPPIHWDGTSWMDAGPFDPAHGGYSTIWGSGPSDIYAGSYAGEFAHYDGTTWTPGPQVPDDRSLLAIRGSSATNIWAITQSTQSTAGKLDDVLMRYLP